MISEKREYIVTTLSSRYFALLHSILMLNEKSDFFSFKTVGSEAWQNSAVYLFKNGETRLCFCGLFGSIKKVFLA